MEEEICFAIAGSSLYLTLHASFLQALLDASGALNLYSGQLATPISPLPRRLYTPCKALPWLLGALLIPGKADTVRKEEPLCSCCSKDKYDAAKPVGGCGSPGPPLRCPEGFVKEEVLRLDEVGEGRGR